MDEMAKPSRGRLQEGCSVMLGGVPRPPGHFLKKNDAIWCILGPTLRLFVCVQRENKVQSIG